MWHFRQKFEIIKMEEQKIIEIVGGFIEISVPSDDDFLIIRETLSRIGIANRKTQTLYQSVNILHKRGKYYLCHFKQLMELDGRSSTLDDIDRGRLLKIAKMLAEWGLTKIINIPAIYDNIEPQFAYVLSAQQAKTWQLVEKYKIGNKK